MKAKSGTEYVELDIIDQDKTFIRALLFGDCHLSLIRLMSTMGAQGWALIEYNQRMFGKMDHLLVGTCR